MKKLTTAGTKRTKGLTTKGTKLTKRLTTKGTKRAKDGEGGLAIGADIILRSYESFAMGRQAGYVRGTSSIPLPAPKFREYCFSLALFQCSCTPRLGGRLPSPDGSYAVPEGGRSARAASCR
jgi:hypothetical protein